MHNLQYRRRLHRNDESDSAKQICAKSCESGEYYKKGDNMCYKFNPSPVDNEAKERFKTLSVDR